MLQSSANSICEAVNDPDAAKDDGDGKAKDGEDATAGVKARH
jgi:hypothetical protein